MTAIATTTHTPTLGGSAPKIDGCECCGFKGKLYREYNCYIRPGDIKCYKCHVEAKAALNPDGSLAWMVLVCPTAQDPTQYWGMSCGPAEDWARVQALPDNK